MRRIAIVFLALIGVVAASALVLWLARKTAPLTAPPSDAKVAKDLAILCQTLDAPIGGMGHVWLPESAKALHPRSASAGPRGADLWLGGGHEGGPHYVLTKGSDANWTLSVNTGREFKELAVVHVPPEAKEPLPVFTERVLKEYEREIDKDRNDRFRHLQRIEFGMRFRDRAGLRALMADSIARAPELSETRMALALFDDAGMRELQTWAHSPPTFRKLTDLAIGQMQMKHTDAAIAAAREALPLSMKEERHQTLNASARVLPIAKLALEEKRFDDALVLATSMQNAREIDEYSRKRFVLDWRSIRAAATYREGDHAGAAALVEPDGLLEPEVFYRSDDDPRPKLATAIRAKDDAAVEAWKLKPDDVITDPYFCGVKLLPYLRGEN